MFDVKRLTPVTVITGHYGVGKTNLAINLALDARYAGMEVRVADLDIVNPYFRSSDYRRLLEDAGVQVITSGSIPTDPVRQEYLLMAAVEALTNAVRHGEADRLKIVLTEENGYIRVCFFNNGKNPTLPVREGGGLGALRIRLEEAGGSMQILTTPEFCLSVLLPKKGGREVCYRYRS